MKVGVVFGVSELANPKAFEKEASEFLTALAGFDLVGGQIIGSADEARDVMEVMRDVDALVLYPLTGGTEGFLKEFSALRRPTVVFGNPYNNSLAAGIEIREFLRERLIPSTLVKDLDELKDVLSGFPFDTFEPLLRARLGLIGRISPWLINERFELPYTEIGLDEFYRYYEEISDEEGWKAVEKIFEGASEIKEPGRDALTKAGRIYLAIERILKDYRLDGFTIGCFDIIMKLKATPCLALAMFNAQGIPAGCEGELNSLLGMYIVRKYFDKPAFMGNVADFGRDYVIIAHCTAPLLWRYRLRSHFESGMGVGVDVEFPRGKASLFKLRGRRAVVAEVEVTGNEHLENRCRTQVRLKLEDAREFLDGTLGNHHLLAYVESEELADLLGELGFEVMLY